MKGAYGTTSLSKCFFCGQDATTKNKDGFNTCRKCTERQDQEYICPSCGSELEIQHGRYGTFFICASCGPISQTKYQNFYKEPSGNGKWKVQKNATKL